MRRSLKISVKPKTVNLSWFMVICRALFSFAEVRLNPGIALLLVRSQKVIMVFLRA